MAKRVAFVVLLAAVGIAAGVAGVELRRWQANDGQAVIAATTTTFAPVAPEPATVWTEPVEEPQRSGGAPEIDVGLEDAIAAIDSTEALCPFSDIPVPADGECPDERPPPTSDIARRAAEREAEHAVRAASIEAEVGPAKREALTLAQSGRLAEALEVIDARLAEDQWCNSIGTECSFTGTAEEFEEWEVLREGFDALRNLRCELLVNAGIVADSGSALWAMSKCWLWAEMPVEGLSHPKVQDDARAVLEDVVATHEQQWPWLRSTWESSTVVFYDSKVPEMCSGAAACVLSVGFGSMMVFTLDLLAEDWYDEALVHELAHVWTTIPGSPAQEALDAFSGHYAGCRTLGLSSEQFVQELLADAVAVMTLGLNGRGHGYYGLDFDGCLVEGPPPKALNETLRARLAMPVTVWS